MPIKAKSYPHPVLGNEDDFLPGSRFDVSFEYESDNKSVILRMNYSLTNDSIEERINSRRASFVTEVMCGRTFYRKSFTTSGREHEINIPAHFLRERVDVSFFVCNDEQMENYSPIGCHEDYLDAHFPIEVGDVLAIGGYTSFIAEKSFDPLRPPVSSFMSIMEGNEYLVPADVHFDSEKIVIVLSKNDWAAYRRVREDKAAEGLLHSSIVFPALMRAIYEVQKPDSEYSDNNWFQRLETILTAKGLVENDPFYSAQRIIQNPLSRGFKGIESVITTPTLENL